MNQDDQSREHELRERIASQMRSIGKRSRKSLPGEELEKLKTAAGRLERMLKASAAEDREALRNAATRLDNLLRDLRHGDDVTTRLKRRTKTNDSRTKQV